MAKAFLKQYELLLTKGKVDFSAAKLMMQKFVENTIICG